MIGCDAARMAKCIWPARCMGWLAAAVVLVALTGCGGRPQGMARGRVTVDGEPLAHGTIAFLPADGKGPTAGGIVKDGQYEVRGMAPGRKIVRVEGFDAEAAFPATSAEMAEQAATRPRKPSEPGPVAGIVPPDAAGNNSERDVAAGEQVVDVAVSREKQR